MWILYMYDTVHLQHLKDDPKLHVCQIVWFLKGRQPYFFLPFKKNQKTRPFITWSQILRTGHSKTGPFITWPLNVWYWNVSGFQMSGIWTPTACLQVATKCCMMTEIQTIEGGWKDVFSLDGTTLKNIHLKSELLFGCYCRHAPILKILP